MKDWELLEQILRKPLEQIIDAVTGNWICKPCDDKLKFIKKEFIFKAAKDKAEGEINQWK